MAESDEIHELGNRYAAAHMLAKVAHEIVIPDAREHLREEGKDSPRFQRALDECFIVVDQMIEALPPDPPVRS